MQSVQILPSIPAFGQMPARIMHRRPARRYVVRKGELVFSDANPLQHPYVVATGEVMIVRDGQLIDLVEPGELLDQSIWAGSTAIAHANCTLSPQLIAA